MRKDKKTLSLSEVDHKLQFINVVAVIGDITPIISRSKLLAKVELRLLDETVTKKGFNVKLNLESKTLDHFLNVAKRGFIIQLNDIKVTKNEGEVYGEVKDEEEITLFSDSPNVHKWYPGEKPTAVTDTLKLKILSLVKWKKANSKDIEVLPEDDEDQTKTRRSGLGSGGKGQSASKIVSKVNVSNSSTVSKNSSSQLKKINQKIEDKLTLHKENKSKDIIPRRSKLEISNLKNEPTKRLRTNKSITSSEEVDSPSTSSSRTSISSSPSRLTRAINASTLNKSSSLSNLNKSISTRTLNKSLSLSRLNKSDKKNESGSLSRLNQSESQTSLDGSRTSFRRKKITKGMGTKGESSENDSMKSIRLNRSRSSSKINKIKLSSDSDFEEINKEQNSNACSFSSASHKPDKEHNKNEDESKVDQTRRSAAKKEVVGRSDNNVETSVEAENVELNLNISTKVEIKETEKKSVSKEKLNTSETLKTTRQNIINKTSEGSPSLSKTVGSVGRDSKASSTNTTSKLNKSESHTNKGLRKRENDLGKEKNLCNRNIITRTKGADQVIYSPIRKRACLLLKGGNSSDTSSENSPKTRLKPGSLGKNPTLNSSDSTISETSNPAVKIISSLRESIKRECYDVEKSPKSVSGKKRKLVQETVTNKIDCLKPILQNKSPLVNEEEIRTCVKGKEVLSKEDSKRKNDEVVKGSGLSKKSSKSGPDVKTNRNKEDPSSEIIMSPKTCNQILEKSELNEDINIKQTRNTANSTNKKECSKYGVYETYLRSLTKKLNFISVENITDISLYDLEEVYVPDKFDLQCKVVSEFVLVEDGIQVVRVQDGTVSKCGTLRIPQGPSWDAVLKEILENPIVEEKSQYLDIIIFNYFRLEFPLKPNKFFQINNIMAVKFQLKRDPRQGKKSMRELFFCVEGQNANIKKLYRQQIKELKERLTTKPLDSKLSSTVKDKATVVKPVSDSVNFKFPNSPSVDSTITLSTDGESPMKTKAVVEDSGRELRKRKLIDSDSDFEPKATSKSERSPPENKARNKNIRKYSEPCKDNKNTENNPQAKINTTNSSDETMMGETPPLLKEIKEFLREESTLGLPLTISEDIHLKNSGSEVTFSQFCEGAKLKGDNFRTSTQGVEADVAITGSFIVSKSNDLTKDVLVASEEVIHVEDSSKMEPLVYCPSGSSVSSAVCGSPDKGKTKRDFQDSQHCSASVLQGARLKTISDLKHSNSESQIVSNDNISDVSNSTSVKVISSNSSVGLDFEVLGSKEPINSRELRKNQSTTKVIEVEGEHSELLEVKDLPSDAQEKVSLSLKKTPVLLKDKESTSLLENGCTDGNIVNKESTNNEIEFVSDSSNASLLTAENNATIKAGSSVNASRNIDDDLTVHNLEQITKMIPDRCFYKSPTTPPTLTEHELNEIYDDEQSPVKFFSYCHNRDLPMLTLDIIEKIKNTNSLTMTVTFVSIIPAFTDCWRESCIKARCPSCEKSYDVFNAANNRNNENTSPMAAISVGSHVVCPDSQCCNQILENPEFHFTVEFKLKDGTPLTALLAGNHAEEIFGCSAQEAMKNESALSRVAETLEKITRSINDRHPTKIVVTRDDICNPKSGPLCVAHIS